MKRIIFVLTMLTCLFTMTACGNEKAEEPSAGVSAGEEELKTVGEQFVMNLVSLDKGQIEVMLEDPSMPEEVKPLFESWASIRSEVGEFRKIKDIEINKEEDAVTIVVNAAFSKKDGSCTLMLDEQGQLAGGNFDREYSMGEIFKKAVLNTLMGMGTVFAVLIFISFIISLFKYIPDVQKRFSKKAETVTETAVSGSEGSAVGVVGNPSDDDVVKDEELAAVIMAAVYAAMEEEGTAVSKDRLVVRSIRRSRR